MEKTRFEFWLGLLSFIPCEDMLACACLVDMLRVSVLRGNCVTTFLGGVDRVSFVLSERAVLTVVSNVLRLVPVLQRVWF